MKIETDQKLHPQTTLETSLHASEKKNKSSHPVQNAKPPQDGQQNENQSEGSVDTIQKVDHPKMYKVILLNDDFTPMDFVVLVLRRFFAKSEEGATQVMLDVHQKGAGVAGIFTLEIGEMKVMQVNQFARMNQYPLKCTLEAE